MLANLSSTPLSCFAAFASFCGPPGRAATPVSAASNAGTAASTAVAASLRPIPNVLAMRPIVSGVRNCMMRVTRFVAMSSAPELAILLPLLVRVNLCDGGAQVEMDLGPTINSVTEHRGFCLIRTKKKIKPRQRAAVFCKKFCRPSDRYLQILGSAKRDFFARIELDCFAGHRIAAMRTADSTTGSCG